MMMMMMMMSLIIRPTVTQLFSYSVTLARVVTGKRYTDPSVSILKELHWLPIDARVKFKIATLTFKALNAGNPPYLASLLHRHTPCQWRN